MKYEDKKNFAIYKQYTEKDSETGIEQNFFILLKMPNKLFFLKLIR